MGSRFPNGIADATQAEINYLAGLVGGQDELEEFPLNVRVPDVSTASDHYVVSPYDAQVISISSGLQAAITAADAVLTAKIGAATYANGAITIAQSGSAAGDVDSVSPTAMTIGAGAAITISGDGGSTNTADAIVTLQMRRI
jgi:hypothetical protein